MANLLYLVHRLPSRWLRADGWLFRERALERSGLLYVDVLRIKRWKPLLPEAGNLFAGGFDKSALADAGDDHLVTHLQEGRRAELGHWLALACGPLFLLWNPWYAGVALQAYAVAANGPCIASSRYNRIRLLRVLARRARLADPGSDPTTRPPRPESR